MLESVRCPQCQRRLELPSEYLGQQVQCPQCAATFTASTAPLQPTPPAEAIEPDSPLPPPAPRPPSLDDDGPPIKHRRARLASTPEATPAPRHFGARRTLAVVLAIACMAGCFVCYVAYKAPPDIPRVFEQPDLFPRAGKDGLPGVVVVNNEPPEAQMRDFFRQFAAAVRAGDVGQLARFFDGTHMVEHGMANGPLPRMNARDRAQFVHEVNRLLADSFVSDKTAVEYFGATIKIQRVQKGNAGELIVLVSHRPLASNHGRDRWTVVDRDGFWKITDHAPISFGLTLFDVRVAAFGPVNRPHNQDVIDLNSVTPTLGLKPDLAEAERRFKNVQPDRLPARVLGAYHQIHAQILLHQHRDQDCLVACDKAEQANADIVGVDLLRSVALNNLHKFDQALVLARKNHERLGDDSDVFHEIGFALQETGKFREAAVQYRKALDEEPNRPITFLSLLRCMGPDVDRRDIGERFLGLASPQDHFDEYARDVWDVHDGPTLEKLAGAMCELEPKRADAHYYLALARAEQKQIAPALAAFKEALRLQAALERRHDYYHQFARVVARHDQVLQVYAGLPDPELAFATLAKELKATNRLDDWRELVRVHGEKHPNDPVVQLQRADGLVGEEKYAEAIALYKAALFKVRDDNLRKDYDFNYVRARYHAGDILGAYRDSPASFGQLANLCWDDRKADALHDLVAAHRKGNPGDIGLARAQWRVEILRGRPAEAGKAATAAWQKALDPETKRAHLEDFIFDMIDTDRVLDAYRHAPDPARALDIIADDLQDGWRTERGADLKTLVAERRKEMPGDLHADLIEAAIAHGGRDWKAAARLFHAAWPRAAEPQRQRWLHAYLYSSHKSGQTLEAYQQVKKHPQGFRTLASIILADKNQQAFEKLLDAHRPEHATEPNFDAYEARLKILQGKTDEATALLEKAWKDVPADGRQGWIGGIIADLEPFNRALDAYRCAPDKMLAFQSLTWRYHDKKHIDDWQKLLDDHTRSHPTDTRLPNERGELHLLKDELPEAEKQFLLAKQKGTPAEAHGSKRGLMRVRIRQGKAADAYREMGPGTTAFQDIANQCFSEKNAEQLAAVLAAHRQAFPQATNLASWDVEVLWLKKDYPATADAILAQRAALLSNYSSHRWKCEGYLIRSLVRTGKFNEALQEAETMNKRKFGPQVLLILALAAKGDVPATLAQVEKARDREFLAEDCYRDEDLGPIVRTERFEPFRKRFPEPQEK